MNQRSAVKRIERDEALQTFKMTREGKPILGLPHTPDLS